jgi:hypothetical protein
MRDAKAQLFISPGYVMGDAGGPPMNRQGADASATVDGRSPQASGRLWFALPWQCHGREEKLPQASRVLDILSVATA